MYESKRVYISPFGREFNLPTIEQVVALIAQPGDTIYIVGFCMNERGYKAFNELNDIPILFNRNSCCNFDTVSEELEKHGVSLDTPVTSFSSILYDGYHSHTLCVDLDQIRRQEIK